MVCSKQNFENNKTAFEKKDTIIPPNCIMNIAVTCDEYDGGICVEYDLRAQPGKKHCIGRCVTTSVYILLSHRQYFKSRM